MLPTASRQKNNSGGLILAIIGISLGDDSSCRGPSKILSLGGIAFIIARLYRFYFLFNNWIPILV